MKNASIIAVVLTAIFLAFVLKILFLDVMRVQGGSMIPTLRSGEVLFVDRWAFGAQFPFVNRYFLRWGTPKRNDLVVFQNPLDGILVVKRCIGLQGDAIRVENNTLTVGTRSVPITEEEAHRFERYSAVPPGTIFALGDNVSVSEDSRVYGFIPVSHLFGRVMFDLRGDSVRSADNG